jgi:hypothetical protein
MHPHFVPNSCFQIPFNVINKRKIFNIISLSKKIVNYKKNIHMIVELTRVRCATDIGPQFAPIKKLIC